MTTSSYGLSYVKNEFSLVGVTHVSVRMVRARERECSETVLSLDLMLVLSTGLVCVR